MTNLGEVPAPLKPKEIIAQYGGRGGPIDQLFAAAKEPQFELERNVQIRRARYNWKMVDGEQFISPGDVTDGNGQEIVDFVNDYGIDGEQSGGAQVAATFPVNVLWSDCSKFVAVMGQSAPKPKAVADDPASLEQLGQAQDADAVLREAWTKLRVDQKWRTLAFHQFTTGPIYIHTPFVVDKSKYGQSMEPQIEVGEDGLPVQVGMVPYPNGDVELHTYTVLEVSHAYGGKEIEDLAWLHLEFMENKYRLLDAFPDQLDQYRDSDPPDDEMGASSTAAAEAREAVSNPSGIGRPKNSTDWRFRNLWVKPVHFQAIKDRTAREMFQRQYPNGCYLAKVGSVNVLLDERPMEDEWAICKTGRGERIVEKPICSDVVPIQRAINDLSNLALETVLRAIAKTVVDQMLFDRRSLSTNEALPAEVIFTTTGGIGDISKMIAQIPPAHVSDQLMPIVQWLRTTMQDIDGIRPELSGGGAPTQTYREAKQRKDQALAQLGPQAQEMLFAAERMARNIVRQRARYGSGTIKAPRKTAFGQKTDVVNQAAIAETGWHCEADDNFPITTADTSDKLWGLLKEFPPEVQQALSLLDPINLERNLQLLQLPGYESTYEDQKRKTLGDVAKLLQAQPIDGPPGPDGQPGPPQPSIPIDSYDDHQFVADFLRKLMVSKDGQDEANSNPQGFANLAAFQQAHFQAAQPPAPPPPPPMRGALNWSAKLEDFPGLVPEVLQGAGLPAPPPGAEVATPPIPPPKPETKDGLDAPQPVEGLEQEAPLPPLPDGPPHAMPPHIN
jgi:hypothetical protein